MREGLNLSILLKNVPEIRILPMSKNTEFYDAQTDIVQNEFFMKDLQFRESCRYHYKNSGINCEDGTLVLFQYDNKIIASAQVKEIEREQTEEYKGAICFYRKTIQIFEPFSVDEITKIDSNIRVFSQAKQRININYLESIIQLIQNRKIFFEKSYQEKVAEAEADPFQEDQPKDKQKPISAEQKIWSRNPIEGKKSLMIAAYKCEINPDHKTFISKCTGENFVECHHLVPMKYQGEHAKSIDLSANIVALCPVCHRKLHFAELEEKTSMLSRLLKDRKERLKKIEIEISLKKLLEYYI